MKLLKADYVVNDTIQTVVGFDSAVSGILNTESSIRLEGDYSGEINSQGSIYVGIKSKVKADIRAQKLVVAGEIEGDVEVVDSIEILRTGKIFGNIAGKRLIVEEGASFKGNVNMDVIAPSKVKES